ncbi:tRNA uridine-5-carboxymethylaminomethyl(34) synthesis GTPase MnmE [Roseobacter denitrificans]|uniref:tRNA modification GTPase MnmE n=1 Tax=Roseobacter denitrificans (strain ATCC 33942 / OCh 114) TaxID=375451 RepID=MNME_ROSDO|nr:tRNA uridine-5-carboxymethylaminomethyl(34) synthesis GTPase MnmE [Roseobacter denitrificans]Q16CZ5.1 RecName: Full=tRNA modification GTPase MnmE [Roseobacter denitrificans OCh 114]ABG30148.1 tRNA modification GTPase TrmE, putative [Roseobacter denitrificans OCh 114]AVL53339.1 tRNA uridine-5-carboxymethylaminomethyl(34) synthesis GTPase MnmE [Roseobacter denitrificans]SFF70051.1 tRNA modification GTPase trmE [Roseobacter denitrificans OCh 114]
MDTVFALGSAQGRAGVSVIRLSGPAAWAVAETICGSLPDPRKSAVRVLRAQDGSVIDQALVLAFKAPHSFTGEDVVEFHVHGSIAVVRTVLDALSDQDVARLAEAGEFTRRALENGKLDLSQVEGLADLIDAETEAQRRQAVRVLTGALGEKVEVWRSKLIRAAALIEATIDFADEDVPVDVTPEVTSLLEDVSSDVRTEVAGTHVAERIRSGFEIALVGAPNAGKSTLLNKLAGRDAAITSEIAGTTRDVIEVRMDLGGLPVTFLDTAGLRQSADEIETIGIERAIKRAQEADLRVFLSGPDERLLIEPLEDDIRLTPKVDLAPGSQTGISGKTGQGIPELLEKIRSVFSERVSAVGLATHERHRLAMQRALEDLDNSFEALLRGPEFYDITAQELRSAIRALETLVGRIDAENLLDEIFSSFCLGK